MRLPCLAALAVTAWLFCCVPAKAQATAQEELRQGLTALNTGDLAKAQEFLERASRTEPRNALVWVGLAQTYMKSGQKDLAVQAAGRAEEYSLGAATVEHALALFYGGYVQVLLQEGEFAKALAVLVKCRRRFPKDPQITLSFGVASYAQRRFADAVSAFLEVVRLDASIEQPYVFLGRILEHAGQRLPEVITAYAAWEKSAPGNYLPVFLHAKAMSTASQADESEIEKKLRHSIQLNAAFWESRLELGSLLARQGRWPEAASELTRCVELNPQHAGAHYQLARAYQRLGKTDMARTERAEYQRLRNAEDSIGLR